MNPGNEQQGLLTAEKTCGTSWHSLAKKIEPNSIKPPGFTNVFLMIHMGQRNILNSTMGMQSAKSRLLKMP